LTNASLTAALIFGSRNRCIGDLWGKENKGLAHMFKMMNRARINTAVSSLTMASTAYRNALAYTAECVQAARFLTIRTMPSDPFGRSAITFSEGRAERERASEMSEKDGDFSENWRKPQKPRQ
jgi:alkylation response protein AidB-like acyl-CoA dehydrogenase